MNTLRIIVAAVNVDTKFRLCTQKYQMRNGKKETGFYRNPDATSAVREALIEINLQSEPSSQAFFQ